MNGQLNSNSLENIKKLSVSERILIVEDIWDSIISSEEDFPITDEQIKHLDSRLEAYNKNPKEGISLKEVKNIPKFKNEEEEREFWANNDSSDFIEWNKSKLTSFPKLRPSTKTISLRLPEFLLNDIKIIAHKRDVPYQSLIKIILKERIDSELRNSA